MTKYFKTIASLSDKMLYLETLLYLLLLVRFQNWPCLNIQQHETGQSSARKDPASIKDRNPINEQLIPKRREWKSNRNTYILCQLLRVVPITVEEKVAVVIRDVSDGNDTVHRQRPFKALGYLCELDGEYLQGGRSGHGAVGWAASWCVVCKLRATQCRCSTQVKESVLEIWHESLLGNYAEQ